MRARTLALSSLMLVFAISLPAAPHQSKDAKQDKGAKKDKEPEKISAKTEINGKNLDQWIALIKGRDHSLTVSAIENIVLFGPELAVQAVPDMLKELEKHASGKQRIDTSVRTTIPVPLAMILASFKDPDKEHVARAVKLFKSMMLENQQIIKLRAVDAVGHLGPLAKEALPELRRAARDPDSYQIRSAAVIALATVAFDGKNPPDKFVVDVLAPPLPWTLTTPKEGLNDSSREVRLNALQTLNILRVSQAKQYKKRYLDALTHMAKSDPDEVCQLRAHLSMYYMLDDKNLEKAKQLSAVGGFCGHNDAVVRMEAAKSLALVGPDASNQVGQIVPLLKDKDMVIVSWAMVALTNIKDRRTVASLKRIVDDTSLPPAIRATAQNAIYTIEGLPPQEAPKKGADKR